MMHSDFVFKVFNPLVERLKKISVEKGKEYANDLDRLANFKEVAEETGIESLQVWLVFMSKHYRAIASYVREGKEFSSERIEGRFDDLIMYSILGLAIVMEQKEMKAKEAMAKQITDWPFADDPTKVVKHQHFDHEVKTL